jgi:hypothetical protein
VALHGGAGPDPTGWGWCDGGMPQDMRGQKTSASFLYNGTRNLFEQAGFEYQRPKAKNYCVMRLIVQPS